MDLGPGKPDVHESSTRSNGDNLQLSSPSNRTRSWSSPGIGLVASLPQGAIPFALSPLPPVSNNLPSKSCILVSNGAVQKVPLKVKGEDHDQQISTGSGDNTDSRRQTNRFPNQQTDAQAADRGLKFPNEADPKSPDTVHNALLQSPRGELHGIRESDSLARAHKTSSPRSSAHHPQNPRCVQNHPSTQCALRPPPRMHAVAGNLRAAREGDGVEPQGPPSRPAVGGGKLLPGGSAISGPQFSSAPPKAEAQNAIAGVGGGPGGGLHYSGVGLLPPAGFPPSSIPPGSRPAGFAPGQLLGDEGGVGRQEVRPPQEPLRAAAGVTDRHIGATP